MKHTTFTCNFCDHPIDNMRAMYCYRGENYTWLFYYEDEFHMHQVCIKIFQEAKRLAEKSARESYETARINLAPKKKPEEIEPNDDW
jgi:hypothetical protein